MEQPLKHSLDLDKLAQGFGLSKEETIKFLNDGRIVGRLGEFIFANKIGGNRAKSEGSSYDIDGANGERIEVRSITHGISFASSKEVGYGRHVTESGYSEKINSLDLFVGIDFRNLSELVFHKITKDDLIKIEQIGILRKNKSVCSNKIYEYLKNKS